YRRSPSSTLFPYTTLFRSREFVGGERGANLDVLRVVTFDHHVGLTDGVGLVVDFFTVEVDVAAGAGGRILFFDKVLRLGEHTAAAAGRVVNGNGEWQVVFDGVKDQVRHQLDHFTRGEVLTGLFVVFFVELADQLFKHIAHSKVAEGWQLVAIRIGGVVWGQIDFG